MNLAIDIMTADPETIAIIDNDPGIRKSLVRILSAMGYQTEQYDSPEALLASVDRSQACCLIVDVDLGSMSGLDLVRHPTVVALKRPIILNSAGDDPDLVSRALAAGCCAFLHKPYTATSLLGALIRATERYPPSHQ